MMEKKSGFIRRTWDFFRKPSAKYSVLAIGVVSFFIGIFFWGSFNTGLEATNKLEFCIGCHEMRDTPYQEYKETVHYKNRTGVRAVCSDCHVPHEWGHKMWRKIQASREVWSKLTGYVDTPEKFEKNRMEMATKEWARMKAAGSRECKNCHNFDNMEAKKQKPKAQENHAKAQKEGKTCIDCHKGIAHLLPKEYNEDE